MTTPTEAEIAAKMKSAGVTRAWAIIMLQKLEYTEADYRADYERMKRETAPGFTGAWAMSLSGIQCYAATPELAEARAERMEQPQPLVDDDEPEVSGNYTRDEVDYMRHPM